MLWDNPKISGSEPRFRFALWFRSFGRLWISISCGRKHHNEWRSHRKWSSQPSATIPEQATCSFWGFPALSAFPLERWCWVSFLWCYFGWLQMSDVATDKGQNFLIDQRWEQIGWPPLFSAWANCNKELRVGFLGTPKMVCRQAWYPQ